MEEQERRFDVITFENLHKVSMINELDFGGALDTQTSKIRSISNLLDVWGKKISCDYQTVKGTCYALDQIAVEIESLWDKFKNSLNKEVSNEVVGELGG